MKRGRLIAVLLLLLSGACKENSKSADKAAVTVPKQAPKAAESQAAEQPGSSAETLESEEYRFRLTKPDPSWKLKSRSEIQKITSDAQAGLSHGQGLMGVVIVERASGMDLEAMGTLILDSMPLENKKVIERENSEFLGLPAISYALQGSVNDVPMDYAGRLFLRQGFAYQLVAFSAQGVSSKSEMEELFSAFSLLEGEIRPAGEQRVSPDTVGVGWKLEDGVFQSAMSGLRVKPTGNWRAVVGAEARRINADAEVILVSTAPEAYFLVLPERIGEASPEVYRSDRIAQTRANMKGEVTRTDSELQLLGKTVERVQLKGSDFPWIFDMAIGIDDGWALQATGWFSASYGEEGSKALDEAFAAIERMSEREQKALREELLTGADRQNHVGAQHSLRAGVFIDYAHGVRWDKPRGFWEISVGQAARSINPIAQLYARYENSAAHMLLVTEDRPAGTTGESYHTSSVQIAQANLQLELKSKGKPTRLRGGTALMSEASTRTAGIELYYRVVTATAGQTALQLHLWGPAAGMAEHRKALDAVQAGLSMQPSIAMTRQDKGAFIDQRMGYKMKLGGDYAYADSTPSEIAGIGSFASWGVDGKDWVGVLALCMIEEGQDQESSLDMMEERIKDSYDELVHELSAERNDVEVFGRPARHLIWNGLSFRLDAYLFRHDKTIYAILATDAKRGTSMRDKALAGFSFLD